MKIIKYISKNEIEKLLSEGVIRNTRRGYVDCRGEHIGYYKTCMKNRIEYKGFYIDKTENGYRICRQEDTEKHTHLSNLNPSYRLIDNVLSNKIPTRCGCYYLESHARLSYDENYIRKIREYIKVKQNKSKQMYYNPGRKRSGGNF